MLDSAKYPLLEALRLDQYRIGNAQAILYDRRETAVLPPDFLAQLYWSLNGDRYSNRRGMGILETLFCGMSDVSFPAIVSYLAGRPVVAVGVWHGDKFKVAGFTFPTAVMGVEGQKSAFVGYGFLKEFWGTDEQEVCTILGLSMLFNEMNLLSIHGQRFHDNDFTAKFMEKFGFKDIGRIPHFLLKRGKLVDGMVNTLSIDTFESKLAEMLAG